MSRAWAATARPSGCRGRQPRRSSGTASRGAVVAVEGVFALSDCAVVHAPRQTLGRVAAGERQLILVELVCPVPALGHRTVVVVGAPRRVEPEAASVVLFPGLGLHQTHLGVRRGGPHHRIRDAVGHLVGPAARHADRRVQRLEAVAIAPAHATHRGAATAVPLQVAIGRTAVGDHQRRRLPRSGRT